MRLPLNKWLKGSLWIAAAACGVLAITAPATITSASQAGAARKVSAVGKKVPVVPPHMQEIRKALAGMVVAIDPATGEFRAPTQEEHETLTESASASSRAAAPQPIDLPGGGSIVLTSPENIDFLTAVQGADGKLAFRCTHGLDSTTRTFAAAHGKLSREVRRDR